MEQMKTVGVDFPPSTKVFLRQRYMLQYFVEVLLQNASFPNPEQHSRLIIIIFKVLLHTKSILKASKWAAFDR